MADPLVDIEYQRNIVKLPANTVAGGTSLPAGTNNIGDVDVLTLPPVDTELPAAAALSDAMINPTTPMVGASLMIWDGTQWKRLRCYTDTADLAGVTITTITTVWTPTSGKKIRLMGGSISVNAAVSILFEDNAGGTTVFRTPKLIADTPYTFDLGPEGKLLAGANNVLKATSSAAAVITGTLYGISTE